MQTDTQLETALKDGFDPKILYNDTLITIKEPMCVILEKHSRIPVDQVVGHVNNVIAPSKWLVPCNPIAVAILTQWSFPTHALDNSPSSSMRIATSQDYPEMLERVKKGQKLLDLGCAFGQELRQLIYDGAPGESLYSSDIQQEFLNLGYELFQDRATLPETHLIASNPGQTVSPLHPPRRKAQHRLHLAFPPRV
ncbi:hypothetical protein BDW60DRAFT_210996 [Aspergillus nidulans var. acristatus]